MADDIELRIEPAPESDTPTVLRMIRALVVYERLTHEFTVTESILRAALFGERPAAEVALGYVGTERLLQPGPHGHVPEHRRVGGEMMLGRFGRPVAR